jgi:hypothetical protein
MYIELYQLCKLITIVKIQTQKSKVAAHQLEKFRIATKIISERRKLSSGSVSGLPDFPWFTIPKRGNIYQMTIKYVYQIATNYKIYQMTIKYTNMVQYETLEKLPKLGFFV